MAEPRARDFAVLIQALVEHVPDDVGIRSLEITFDDRGRRLVHVRTRTVNRFLVGDGAAVKAVCAALADHFADAAVQLNIEEVPPWSGGDAPEHPSGDRAPRPPSPPAPPAASADHLPSDL